MLIDYVKCKIGSLVNFFEKYPEHLGKIDVETRFGAKRILAAEITARDSDVISIRTESQFVSCSPDHKIFTGELFSKAKELKVGDLVLCKTGLEKIISIHEEPYKKDLVDIQVEDVEEYYSNGIVSHNSSIISDALSYALFGKPFRKINIPQLINSINQKDCQVELTFQIANDSYKIIRAMKPHKFEIYKNDELLKQEAATKDYQTYLETQILKISHKTFVQILVLGSAVFTPFMQLPAGARRGVIEDLLDINVFGVMLKLLKEKIQKNKEETIIIDGKLDSAKKESVTQKRLIETLSTKNDDQLTLLLQELEAVLADMALAKQSRDKVRSDIGQLVIPDFTAEILEDLRIEYNMLKKQIQQDIKKSESISSIDHCPTCLQSVNVDHKERIKSELQQKYEEHKPKLSEYEKRIAKLTAAKTEFDELKEKSQHLYKELAAIDQKIISLEELETSIRNKIDTQKSASSADLDKEKDRLRELAQDALKLIERKNELITEKQIQEVSLGLLKDTGIKASIIKEYLPILNKMINKYLTEFDFFINFVLDENFNEQLLSRGRDSASYFSLSEGEKKRVDVAILLSFRHIASLKNSAKINLLVLDELDSGLDHESRLKLLELIQGMESDVWMVSHSIQNTELEQQFDKVAFVMKKGDFQEMFVK